MMTRSLPKAGGAGRRLLVINPNGNPSVTALVDATAKRILAGDTRATVINPAASPISIETPADRARAEPLAIELLRANPGYDAYVMACFDDIALEAGRALSRAPVVGAFEASVALARTMAARFAIVTTVETAVPGIKALLASHGAAEICGVFAAGVGVAEAAGSGSLAEARISAAVDLARRGGATAIILGSAGLNGRAAKLRAEFGLPIIDGIEAALRIGEIVAARDRLVVSEEERQ